ncbi:MAG: pneumococcal-type histidine triad protein [Sedimentisphaerales bacterium]
MLKNTFKILITGIVLFIILPGAFVMAGYKAAKITYTISGSIGVNGVMMNGLPGNPVTNENGYYIATVEYGWKGTVTPQKEGYTFEPVNKVYEKVTGNQDNQSYTATLITFTITGSTGQSNVVMNGLPGAPITDEKGNYTATVNYGFSGTITPTKEGYIFDPANKIYQPVKANQTSQDYNAKLMTFTISGTTGMDGVAMNGLPGNPVTKDGGKYSATVDYGFSGTVTPAKEGYTFEPANRIYAKTADNQANQSYTGTLITLTITGSAGQSGVVMNGLPGNPASDADGKYTATVNYGWKGTITPTKEGYIFDPANKIYEPVKANQVSQDYGAKLKTFTISGTAGMDGVVMNGLPGNPVTKDGGKYSATVDYGFSGTVTPAKEGYTFEPANKIYAKVSGDQANQSYTGTLITLTITGSAGQSGVVMNGLPGNPVTNDKGNYTATVNYGFTGTVSPAKEGYIFDPANKIYEPVKANQVSQDYSAKLKTFTISGSAGMDGVVINGLPGNPVTSGGGLYTATVDYGFSGTVTPAKEGYTFEPANKIYAKVTGDQTNQGYTGTLITLTISGTVNINNEPIEGVLMQADNGGGSGITDANGRYSLTVNYGWTGTVTPTKEGYMFDPPNKAYTNVTTNINEDETKKDTERKTDEQKPAAASTEATEPKIVEPAAEAAQPTETTKPTETTAPKAESSPVSAATEATGQTKNPPAEAKPKPPLVSNVFVDTDIRQVLQDISSQTGLIIIPDQTVSGLISCELKEVPLDKALEIVLAGTGYVVRKTPDYYLVSSPEPKEVTFPASSKTKYVKMSYVGADDAVKLLSTAFKKYVQSDNTSSTIVITAPPVLIDRITSDLELIDIPPRHVMLDARIVVMNRQDLLNLGIEWSWPKISAGIFSSSYTHGGGAGVGGRWPWGIQIGYATGQTFTNSLELTLNLLEQNGDATIMSTPQILAQDGKKAEIKVTTEEYYSLLPKTAVGATPYYYSAAELQKIEYGTVLSIIPHIGKEGDITLDMAIEVSDIVMRSTDNYPIITRRVVNNTMRIKDGGTVSVAGLKKTENYTVNKSTPGLSKLPGVGGLFNNKMNQGTSQEIAVFVTAHLIPESAVPKTTLSKEQKQPSSDKQQTKNDFTKELEKSLATTDSNGINK